MNNVIIQYKDRFVLGYSFKTRKVYTTRKPEDAKRFTDVSANEFMSLHASEANDFLYEGIKVHKLRRGIPIQDQIKVEVQS